MVLHEMVDQPQGAQPQVIVLFRRRGMAPIVKVSFNPNTSNLIIGQVYKDEDTLRFSRSVNLRVGVREFDTMKELSEIVAELGLPGETASKVAGKLKLV